VTIFSCEYNGEKWESHQRATHVCSTLLLWRLVSLTDLSIEQLNIVASDVRLWNAKSRIGLEWTHTNSDVLKSNVLIWNGAKSRAQMKQHLHVYQLLWLPSVLRHCWLGIRKSTWPVKNWVMRCLHGYLSEVRYKWLPLPPSHLLLKVQIGLTFLVPAYPSCPGKEAAKWVSVQLLYVLSSTYYYYYYYKRWCLGWHYHAQNVAGPPNKQ